MEAQIKIMDHFHAVITPNYRNIQINTSGKSAFAKVLKAISQITVLSYDFWALWNEYDITMCRKRRILVIIGLYYRDLRQIWLQKNTEESTRSKKVRNSIIGL